MMFTRWPSRITFSQLPEFSLKNMSEVKEGSKRRGKGEKKRGEVGGGGRGGRGRRGYWVGINS